MSKPLDFHSISAALERQEFFLTYQPIVSLDGGGCLGAEALIRWRRPDGTIVEAADFMPITDRTPLSGMITYWVIDTVAAQLSSWLEVNPSAMIAINIPPEILGRGGLEYAAKKSGLRSRASQLLLEITERGVPDQLGLDALSLVPSTGAHVALDDVTFSGANLALLMRCRFDFLKIDGRLVADLADSEAKPAWLEGLGAILGEMPLQIIAEGIETEEQAEILKSAGVPWGQGHHFSRPLLADELQAFYAGRSTGYRH